VRYTKNGDGWPDDVDVTEVATFSAPFDYLAIARAAVVLTAGAFVDVEQEADALERMAGEEV